MAGWTSPTIRRFFSQERQAAALRGVENEAHVQNLAVMAVAGAAVTGAAFWLFFADRSPKPAAAAELSTNPDGSVNREALAKTSIYAALNKGRPKGTSDPLGSAYRPTFSEERSRPYPAEMRPPPEVREASEFEADDDSGDDFEDV